jgi:hypothetical protein
VIRRLVTGALAALLFGVMATANSGGYRYGVSDQAFYLPAIARSLDPSLFPHDAPVLDAQARLWLGDDLVGALARGATVNLPALAGWSYGLGLLLLAAAVAYFLRGLGASWLAVGVGLAVATIRHQITKTGANTLEGYFHPRMLAYALGIWALGCVLRRRYGIALVLIAVSAVLHSTTAIWFGGVVVAAAAWTAGRRAMGVVAGGVVLTAIGLATLGTRMDAPWLIAVAGKSYLFPSAWPAYAWLINLSYPVVLWWIYRRRSAAALAVPGESALVAGLMVLVLGFLVSVPLSAAGIALAVQLQITRVFWVLDAATLLYVVWWLIDDVGQRRGVRWRAAAAGVVAAITIARGGYVLIVETGRPLASWTLPAGNWADVMDWVHAQPVGLNVLADPGHAWRYGSSVRLASLRDTVLEETKDTALAMYDHDVALRVLDRTQALSGFENFSLEQIRTVGARYGADVVLVERPRRLDLPILFANARFTVYSLR